MTASLARQLKYQFQRRVLRRKYLLAEDLPLGMRFRFRTPDDVGRRIYKRRCHEPHILSLLREQPRMQQRALVLDVGANLGWYSVLMERLHPGKAEIYAFEPDLLNREILQYNLELNGCEAVQANECALSDHDGHARLNRYRDINLGRHSLANVPGTQEAVEVKVQRLDSFLHERGLAGRPVELLKVDVEGHEPEVVKGAESTLRSTRLLLLEFTPAYYAPGEAEDMLGRISNSGLEPQTFTNGCWRPTGIEELLSLEGQHDTAWARIQQDQSISESKA